MIKSTLQSWVGAWKELKQWVFPASTEVPSGAQRGAFWIDDVPKWYDGTTERNFGVSEHNALSAIDGGDPSIPYYGHNTQVMQNRQTNAGNANGYALLGSDGKLPSNQLPSYVDDILEFTNKAAFPLTGESGKIYVDLTTNLTWRWSGSVYIEISPSLALGETSATAYRGDRGKIAYDHSQITNANPHGTIANQISLVPVGGIASTNVQGAFAELDSEKLSTSAASAEYVQLKSVLGTGQTSKLTASALNSSTAQGWTKLYSWPPAAYNKRHLMLHATSGGRGTLTGVVSVSFMQEATATTISAANITSEHIAGTVSNFSLIYNTATSMIELWYNDIFSSNQQTVFSPIKISGTTPTAYYGVSQASLPAYSIKFDSIDLHVDYLEGLTGNVQTQINNCFRTLSGITATTDLNTVTTPGSYRLYSNIPFSATYNQPVGAFNYGQLRVFTGQNGQIYQEYTSNKQDDTVSSLTYFRIKFAVQNEWSIWRRGISKGELDGKLDENANAASATYLDRKYWQGYYVGDTYKYMKIISISTNDLNDHPGYESHSIFVGKSFYGEQHHMQGVLNIGMGGTSTSSSPAVSFIGQSRNSKLVYTFDNTNNVLDVYYYISTGAYGGMVQGFVTSIITSTRPSAITLLTGQSQQLSVAGAIDVSYFAINPMDGNTGTNGNLVVAGGSTISGTALVGTWSGNPNHARFGHKDFNTAGGYGFLQSNNGYVNISAPTDTGIYFNINNGKKAWITSDGYTHLIAPPTSADDNIAVTSAWVKDVAAPISHAHGNISNAGAIGTTSGLPVVTSTNGVLTAAAWSTTNPNMDGTASVGSSTVPSRSDHRHPTDTSRLAIGSGLNAGASVIVRAYNGSNTYTSNVIYLET